MSVFYRLLREISLWCLLPVIISRILSIAAHIFRWQLLLKSRQINFGLQNTAQIILEGNFLNLFLPGNFGGDVYRTYSLRNESRTLFQSTGLVILDRYFGFIANFILAIPVLIFGTFITRDRILSGIVFLLALAFIAPLIFLTNTKLASISVKSLQRIGLHKASDLGKRTSVALRSILLAPVLLVKLLALSVIMKIFGALQIFFFALGMAITMAFSDLMVFMPLHNIISALPISFNGLGIRETNMVIFFSRMGISSEQITALAFILLAWTYFSALPGGLLLLFRRKS